MKKKIFTTAYSLMALVLLFSTVSCGSTDSDDVPYADENTGSYLQTDNQDGASEDMSSEETGSEEEIPPLYSEAAGEDSSCEIRVGLQNVYTVDNEEHIAKITDWLQRASDDPETKSVANHIERSGSILTLSINGGEYNVEYFEDEQRLNDTETDENGVVHSQYNVQANGYYYLVPNELVAELHDIVSEAVGHDIYEDYEFDFSKDIVTFD